MWSIQYQFNLDYFVLRKKWQQKYHDVMKGHVTFRTPFKQSTFGFQRPLQSEPRFPKIETLLFSFLTVVSQGLFKNKSTVPEGGDRGHLLFGGVSR